jgi:hypothetical protein
VSSVHWQQIYIEGRTNQWQNVILVSKLVGNYGKLLFIVMAVNGYLSGEPDLEVRSSEQVCNATLCHLARPNLQTRTRHWVIYNEAVLKSEELYFVVSHAISISIHITVYSVKCSSLIIMQFHNYRVFLLEFFIFLCNQNRVRTYKTWGKNQL